MTPLHQFGEILRELIQSIPLSAVRVLFVGSLVLVLIWVLRLPKSAVSPEQGSARWDENLRPVAVSALMIQILIYLLF